MEKEAVGSIQPLKKSNNNLILIIIIIVVLLIIILALAYLGYNYFSNKIEKNETDTNKTNISDTNPIDDSKPGDTSKPKTSVCGDEFCDAWENCSCSDCACSGSTPYCSKDLCVQCLNDGNCNPDGCYNAKYMDYFCSSNSCSYNITAKSENLTNNNCNNGIDDDCDGQKDGLDSECISSSCTNDTGCTSAGTFCSGNTPYNCSISGDGCLDKVNLPNCTAGWQCVNRSETGCEEIKDCTTANVKVDCASSFKECSYGICNSTGKCEIKYNSSSATCRTSAFECDAAETCSGSINCPADLNKTDGTACTGGTCQNGKCSSSPEAPQVWCGFHSIHTSYSDGSMSPSESADAMKNYYNCGSTNDHSSLLDQTEWTDMISISNSNNLDNQFTYFFGVEWGAGQHIHYITMNPPAMSDPDIYSISLLASWLSKNSGIAQYNHPARTSGGTDFSNPEKYNETWIPLAEFVNKGNWHWNYYWDCAEGSGCTTSVNPNIPAGQVESSTGWIKYALDHGIHLGFSCGNDDHSGLPFSPSCYTGISNQESRTRQGIYNALKSRHTWVSEDKIWMDIKANNGARDYLMGDIFKTSLSSITLRYSIKASPGNTIKKVNIFYNGVIVKVIDYSEQDISGSAPLALRENVEDYIFVEAIQSNGERAWSSPIWVTYSTTAGIPQIPTASFWKELINFIKNIL